MSLAITTTQASSATQARAHFWGVFVGELFKITRLRIAWVVLGIYTLFIVGGQLLLASGAKNTSELASDPLGSLYRVMNGDMALVRIFSGIFLLILAAHVVGLEYQLGVIRILLGRGVGRLQLLGAKVLALAVVALVVTLFELAVEAVGAAVIVLAQANGHNPWQALNAAFWQNTGLYFVCVLISMGATLLLGVAASVVGRSLAVGLTVGLSWFAVDNLATIALSLLSQFTHSDFWLKVSGFLLGLLLNRLPDYVVPSWQDTIQTAHGTVTVTNTVSGFGIQPLTTVSETQALLVILAYCVVFAVVAVTLTVRRVVQE